MVLLQQVHLQLEHIQWRESFEDDKMATYLVIDKDEMDPACPFIKMKLGPLLMRK